MTILPHRLIPSEPFVSYDDYLHAVGYHALSKAYTLKPEQILEAVMASGLRGRGGAGFPTGVKWKSLLSHPCPRRYVICNAAEGEPGTFKDRYMIQRNPYALVEGALIAAHVIGAQKIYIAMKKTFLQEIERLQKAIEEIANRDLLREREITLVKGPEEYLFGEEKGLLNVVEGAGPLPREAHYPPYSWGLFATPTSPNPTLVNNAETFSHIPSIVELGGASFHTLGTPDTPGTVIFTLCGDVRNPGVYEHEAGIPLKILFHEIGGGSRNGGRLKATLSGVASPVIKASQFDTPADFGSLRKIGSGLGSAGFIVFEETTSMVRVAQAVARFLYVESCGQCSACKNGLRLSSEALDTLFQKDKVDPVDLERILTAARSAPQSNRCFLPVQGSKLIPSLVEQFREEFEQYVSGNAPPSSPYPIPKIKEYDEKTRQFTYDPKQPYKQPDWSFRFPEDNNPR